MGDARKNFAYSTVAVAPSPATTGTSITVAAGTGAAFPVAPFNATVWPTAAQPLNATAEIIRVTAVTGDVLTIARTQEGTTARAIVVGDQLAATITAKTLMDLDPMTGLGRNRIGLWLPSGNSTLVPGIIGMVGMSVVGTVTARSVATTNWFTRAKRLAYVTGTVAGSLCGMRLNAGQFTLGAGTLGGFRMIARFGCSDAAPVSGARQFVGVSGTIVPPTNVEPNTLTNVIGVGHGASDTNLRLYFGGSIAQTPIDLGVNFPANTLSVDMYELDLFAPQGAATVNWTVTRLNTGDRATGILGPGTAGVTLPAPSTLLAGLQAWRCNNAAVLSVGLDFSSIYTETE